MKRNMMFTAAVMICMLCIATTVRAQDYMDRAEEGKQVVAAAKFLQSQAQKMASAKDIDRAALTDAGHIMIKHGYNDLDAAEMMFTDDGRANMQEIGSQLTQSDGVFLKMGRKKGALTDQEKAEIKKQIDYMNGKGKLMLDKGQMM